MRKLSQGKHPINNDLVTVNFTNQNDNSKTEGTFIFHISTFPNVQVGVPIDRKYVYQLSGQSELICYSSIEGGYIVCICMLCIPFMCLMLSLVSPDLSDGSCSGGSGGQGSLSSDLKVKATDSDNDCRQYPPWKGK